MKFCRSSPILHVSNLSFPASSVVSQEPIESRRRGFGRGACVSECSICINLACTRNRVRRQVVRTIFAILFAVKILNFPAAPPVAGAVNVLIADVVPNRINSSPLRPHAHHELKIIMRSSVTYMFQTCPQDSHRISSTSDRWPHLQTELRKSQD